VGSPTDLNLPVVVRPLLQEYTRRLGRDAPGLVSAFYLVGSLALEAFNPCCSDIDFVAVLTRQASPGGMQDLIQIHAAMARQYPKWNR
jgi:hypothetical protein